LRIIKPGRHLIEDLLSIVALNMVQGKKLADLPNGSTKYKDQQPNMPFQKNATGGGAAKSDSKSQNGMMSPLTI
jgi:hypothetical protein